MLFTAVLEVSIDKRETLRVSMFISDCLSRDCLRLFKPVLLYHTCQHAHFIANAFKACSLHTAFKAFFISYCIRQHVDFTMHWKASSFHIVFVSMLISYQIEKHVNFKLYSSACSFLIIFVSMFISSCIHQNVHFKLYSSACSFLTLFYLYSTYSFIRENTPITKSQLKNNNISIVAND